VLQEPEEVLTRIGPTAIWQLGGWLHATILSMQTSGRLQNTRGQSHPRCCSWTFVAKRWTSASDKIKPLKLNGHHWFEFVSNLMFTDDGTTNWKHMFRMECLHAEIRWQAACGHSQHADKWQTSKHKRAITPQMLLMVQQKCEPVHQTWQSPWNWMGSIRSNFSASWCSPMMAEQISNTCSEWSVSMLRLHDSSPISLGSSWMCAIAFLILVFFVFAASQDRSHSESQNTLKPKFASALFWRESACLQNSSEKTESTGKQCVRHVSDVFTIKWCWLSLGSWSPQFVCEKNWNLTSFDFLHNIVAQQTLMSLVPVLETSNAF